MVGCRYRHETLYLAVHHFRYFLEARSFIAYTDHKPLTLAFAKVSDPWSQQHLAYISEFTTDMRHIAGKDNNVADALSRTPVHTVSTQVGIVLNKVSCYTVLEESCCDALHW